MDHEAFDISTLSANLDEMSIRKQLPFRQQAEKPLLKYSTSEPGPIYLYANPDLTKRTPIYNGASVPSSPVRTLNNNKSASGTTNDSTASSLMGKTPYRSSAQYNFVPTLDPYSRPLSAKDLLTIGIDRGKSLPMSQPKNMSGLHATNMSNSNILKSQQLETSSHLYKSKQEVNSTLKKETSPSSASISHSFSSPAITTTKVTSVASIPISTSTQSAREKFEATLAKPPLPTSQGEKGARPPSALRRPVSSKVRNPHYSPSRPYQDVLYGSGDDDTEFKMVSDVKNKAKTQQDTLNGKITEAITSLSKSKTSLDSVSYSISKADNAKVESVNAKTEVKSSSVSTTTSVTSTMNSSTTPQSKTSASSTSLSNNSRPVSAVRRKDSSSSLASGTNLEDETVILRPSSSSSNSSFYRWVLYILYSILDNLLRV